MRKDAFVGAVALMMGTFAAVAETRVPAAAYDAAAAVPAVPRITEANIARLKSALNLTPSQLPYWAPVESALRSLAREQRGEAGSGAMQTTDRVAAASLLNRMRRLATVARPLIRCLDDTQRRNAMILVRRLGYDSLVASF